MDTITTSRHGMRRRNFIGRLAGTAVLAAGLLAGAPAQAEDAQSISLIVGYPAGGATDVLARAIADGMRAQLGANVLVLNKAGAGGRIATEFVKNAKPDGTTLLFSISSPMVIYPHIYRKLAYDPLTDFAPIGTATRLALALSVGPAVPASVKTVNDYVAWVKGNPSMASFGTVSGTSPHFAGMLLSRAAGLNLHLVPYKGGAPAVTDLIGGHLPATVTPASEVQPYHAAGRLRILATMGAQRPKVLPDVPTMMELGYKDINMQTWIGIFAPAGTPAATVTRLNAALGRTLQQPDVVANIGRLGMDPFALAPEQFGELVKSDYEVYRKSVELTGFQAED